MARNGELEAGPALTGPRKIVITDPNDPKSLQFAETYDDAVAGTPVAITGPAGKGSPPRHLVPGTSSRRGLNDRNGLCVAKPAVRPCAGGRFVDRTLSFDGR